jgi:transposase
MTRYVLPESMIFTDDYKGYTDRMSRQFRGHRRINHSERVYVQGNVHTNTIEGFFGLVKSGIRGTYHSVSAKWLQGYLNEYAWRYNRRNDGRAQFESLLLRAVS